MQYRLLGKTGLRVSALGFGAMRLPQDEDEAVAVIRHALDQGINLIDTAPGYGRGRSEPVVGRALQGRREHVYLSTKYRVASADPGAFRAALETSLTRLDTDYLDLCHFWGLRWQVFTEHIARPGGPLAAARRAQSEGLIRHLAFSFHDTPEALDHLLDTGEFESMLVQYNLLDRANEAGIARAHQLGLGVLVMGPVGGGRLGAPSGAIQALIPGGTSSTPEMALRFVLANPGVSSALSGMGSRAMVDENVATASRREPLSAAERAHLDRMLHELRRLSELYCTGCGYCLPCAQGVNIPEIFRYMNLQRVWGLEEYARKMYARLGQEGTRVAGQPASACVGCGECEPRCPQSIRIADQLREAARVLS